MKITDSLVYVGVEDKTLDLFEGQYPIPNGVTYNSYVILDDKIAIMDTVDKRGQDIWLKNIEAVLKDKIPDYLVVSHMEPDHGASIQILSEKYPSMKIVGNVKTFTMMEQFFHTDFIQQKMIVKEGDTLCLGKHNLQFIMAPMVHWPEVMMSYEQHEKTLFQLMHLEHLALLIRNYGKRKQDVIILILLANMACKFRMYLRKQKC